MGAVLLLPLLGSCASTDKDASESAEITTTTAEYVQCPNLGQVLPVTTSAPMGAVGYLSNGCTGTLLDSQHILTATHCLYNGDGSWQQTGLGNLNFYPNFHPSRLPNPPRAAIDRAVTGERSISAEFAPGDWAIAHLATAISGFPTLDTIFPLPGDQNQNAGYPRDVMAIGNSALGNDPSPCNQGPVGEPMWIPPPGQTYFNTCCGFTDGCFCGAGAVNFTNSWWNAGFVDSNCQTSAVDSDFYIHTTCSIRGGNSGSPILWSDGISSRITGVVAGPGGADPGAQCDNVACGASTPDTVGPSQQRFGAVPWFASNAVIGRDVNNPAVTQIFAKDQDRNLIAMRERAGSAASGPFGLWSTMAGAPENFDRLAAGNIPSGKPFLIGASSSIGAGNLYELRANPAWGSWAALTLPPGSPAHHVNDVDLGADAAGLPVLFAVENQAGHLAWRATRTGPNPGDAWGSWQSLVSGGAADAYKAVAGIRNNAGQNVFLLTSTGKVRWITEPFPVSAPVDLSIPSVTVVDIDVGYWTDSTGIVVMALDDQSRLWQRRKDASLPWDGWRLQSVGLFAPNLTGSNCKASGLPEGLVSLTVSRWMESATVIPAVVATDNRGEVYYTTYEPDPTPCDVSSACTCNHSAHWQPWRTSYHLSNYRMDRVACGGSCAP